MQRAVRDEWAEWVGRRALRVKKIQLFKGGSGVGEAGGKWPLHPLADVNKPAGHSPGGPEWDGGGFGVQPLRPQLWKYILYLDLSLEAQV